MILKLANGNVIEVKTGVKEKLLNSSEPSEWPELFKCSFIQPGLISYNDIGAGMVLVTKEAIDRMAETFVGRPVIDTRHKDVEPKDFENEADGVIAGKPYWGDDGWMWVDFIAWDKDTKEHCRSGKYSVSCAYIPTESKPGGKHNNIDYDQEVVNGEYTHLAIVKHPRYNGAVILTNSIGGSMTFKAWLKRITGGTVANAIDPAGSMVDVDGVKVPLQELIDTYKAEQAEIAAKEGLQEESLGGDTAVPVDGKDVKISDMINSFKNKKARKNADETAEEKAAREKKEADDKAAAEKKNADDKEAKEKADKEEKDKLDKAENSLNDSFWTKENQVKYADKYNALVAKSKAPHKNALELKNAAGKRGGTSDEPAPKTAEDRRAEGQARYGSVVTQK